MTGASAWPWHEFVGNAPDVLQLVPISAIRPSPDNVRLFVEEEELTSLVAVYENAGNRGVVTPDAPVVRFRGLVRGGIPVLECLAGERRITSAVKAGNTHMQIRSVEMTDEEAYDFILAHNDVKPLSTIELAYRSAEMERMGYPTDRIAESLRGRAVYRYLDVGRLIDASLLTSTPKLCDPSIVVWHEAMKLGPEHFRKCLKSWDAGLWTDADCSREFRRKGKVLPPDNAERGFRVTFNGDRLILRGQVDLEIHDPFTADSMIEAVIEHLEFARTKLKTGDGLFSHAPHILHINPLTV